MSGPTHLLPDDAAWEEAATLLIRARAGGMAEARALDNWAADDTRRHALIHRLDDNWTLAGQLDDNPRLAAMREQAHALLPDDNEGKAGWFARHRLTLVAACALFIFSFVGLLFHRQQQGAAMIIASGEHSPRTVRLADGSTVMLDIKSRIAVRFSGADRLVDLISGQARFAVAHDANRPFHVAVGDRDVRAVGTDFNVDADGQTLIVSLIEGKVDVTRIVWQAPLLGAVRADAMPLAAGQQLVFAPNRSPVIRHFDVDAITAWQHGEIILDDQPLVDAIAAVNRYAPRPVRLDASVPAGLRVSGRFRKGDGAAFASNLALLYPQLSVTRSPNGPIIGRASK